MGAASQTGRTDGMPAINAKRVYRIMRQNALLLERKPAVPPSKRAHTGRVAVKESNQRWCSDGFEFCCDNGETACHVRAGLL
ncbi:transposase InsD for insertion element IS2 [Escherichia coli]|nr:transposase InsD for insertion element IS2 [Escherichia coli]